MNSYDIFRSAMGFPVDVELRRALGLYAANKRKAVYEACKTFVVKLLCYRDENGVEQLCGFFNGFFYHDSEPLILTSGHILNYNGATKYVASLMHGTAMQQQVTLEFVKAGNHAGCFSKQGRDGTGTDILFEMRTPDIAVFKSPFQLPHVPHPCATVATVGEAALSVGFKGIPEEVLMIDEGVVSSMGMAGMTITTYADDGFSGCPVLNADGMFIGMVQGGDGQTIQQVNTIPAQTIHDFLVSSAWDPPCPGFRG